MYAHIKSSNMYVSDKFTPALQFRVGWSPRSWKTWACPGTGAQVDMREGVKGKGAGDKSQFVMMQPVVQVLLLLTCEKCVQTTDSAGIFGASSSSCASTLCLTFPPWCLHVAHWMESHDYTHSFKGEVGMITLIRVSVFPAQLRRSLPFTADLTLIHSVDYFGTAWHHVVDLSSSTCYWFHKGVPPSGLIRHQLWSRLDHIALSSALPSPLLTSSVHL